MKIKTICMCTIFSLTFGAIIPAVLTTNNQNSNTYIPILPEIQETSKKSIENILIYNKNILQNSSKVIETRYASINKYDDLQDSNLIDMIYTEVILEESKVTNELKKMGLIKELKLSISTYILSKCKEEFTSVVTEYEKDISNAAVGVVNQAVNSFVIAQPQCGWIFSGHFWDAVSKHLWANSVTFMVDFLTLFIPAAQIAIISALILNKDFVGAADAMASFNATVPEWVYECAWSVHYQIKKWKEATGCKDLFRISRFLLA